MASNPLLALLNFSGTTSPPASSNVTTQANAQNAGSLPSPSPAERSEKEIENHGTSPSPMGVANASSLAANSLLQSLLSPSAQTTQASSTGPSQSQYDQSANSTANDRVTSPAATNSAAELMALLGGNAQRQQDSTTEDQVNSVKYSQGTFSPPNTSKNQISSAVPSKTIFDQVNPFDLFNHPQSSTQTNQASTAKDVTADNTVVTSSLPSLRKDEALAFTEDRQLHALRQLASLRAWNGFDEDSTSGLTFEKNGKVVLNLLSQQPAGKSSLYPAKLEMTAISLLKGPKSPSYYTQQSTNQSIKSRWTQQSIVAGANDIVCYLTGKSKVRIIDEKTGERAMIVSDEPIKSLFINEATAYERTELKVGVITDTSIRIWALTADFGQDERGVKLIAMLEADEGQHFGHATFSRATGLIEESIVAIQSNGQISVYSLRDMQPSNQGKARYHNHQNALVGKPSTNVKHLVGFTQTYDGTLLASIYSTGDSVRPLEVYLQAYPDTSQCVSITLPTLPDDIALLDVSFTALASDGESTRSLIVGFNCNTVLAFVDLATGEYRRIYLFDGASHKQYNLTYWSHSKATLFIFNSLRSSLFTLKPFNKPTPLDRIDLDGGNVAKRLNVEVGQAVGDGQKTIDRIKRKVSNIWTFDDLQPALKECAMPETWMSFAVDDRYEWEGVRLAALYSGGIQTFVLPNEAVKQIALDDRPSLDQVDSLKNSAVESRIKSENDSADDLRDAQGNRANHDKGFDHKQMDRMTANVRKDIPSTASVENARSLADQGLSRNSNIPSGFDASGVDIAHLSQSIVEQIVPAIALQMKNVLESDIQEIFSRTVKQSLSNEIQNVFFRPDTSAHLTKTITSSIIPTVQKTAMDVVTRAMAPHFEEVISDLTTKVEGKIEQGMITIRKDIVVEQSKALLESEAAIRDLTRQVGQLTSMMEGLGRQNAKLERALNDVRDEQKVLSLNSIRAPSSSVGIHQARSSITPLNPLSPNRSLGSGVNGQIANISGSASTPSAYHSNQTRQQDVEDTLLTALSTQSNDNDSTALQNALFSLESQFGSAYASIRSPEGSSRISQAVNLAMIHRLIKILPSNPIPEKIIPWIEVCSSIFDRSDVHISRVFEGIRREMLDGLLQAHHQLFSLTNRTPWWTRERLNDGILRYIS